MHAFVVYTGPVLAAYTTEDYNSRAWTRVERVVSYAYSDTAIPIQVSGGFLHRRQSPTVEQIKILDPKEGALTKEEDDRPLVDSLCQSSARALSNFDLWSSALHWSRHSVSQTMTSCRR